MDPLHGFPLRLNFAGRIEGGTVEPLPDGFEWGAVGETIVRRFSETPECQLMEPYLAAEHGGGRLFSAVEFNAQGSAWRGFLELKLHDARLLEPGLQPDLSRLVSDCATALAGIVSATIAEVLPASEGMARTLAAADPVTASRLAAAHRPPAAAMALPNQIVVRYEGGNVLSDMLKAAKTRWRLQLLAIFEALIIAALAIYILRQYFFNA